MGAHVDDKETDVFQGNLFYASVNQLLFKQPSRRDDLISLCYLLYSMANQGNLPGVDQKSLVDWKSSYNITLKAKLQMTP